MYTQCTLNTYPMEMAQNKNIPWCNCTMEYIYSIYIQYVLVYVPRVVLRQNIPHFAHQLAPDGEQNIV